MKLPGEELTALLVAISFAAGLNVYATVTTLGQLAHIRGPRGRAGTLWVVRGVEIQLLGRGMRAIPTLGTIRLR
jgi:hypothetical protein